MSSASRVQAFRLSGVPAIEGDSAEIAQILSHGRVLPAEQCNIDVHRLPAEAFRVVVFPEIMMDFSQLRKIVGELFARRPGGGMFADCRLEFRSRRPVVSAQRRDSAEHGVRAFERSASVGERLLLDFDRLTKQACGLRKPALFLAQFGQAHEGPGIIAVLRADPAPTLSDGLPEELVRCSDVPQLLVGRTQEDEHVRLQARVIPKGFRLLPAAIQYFDHLEVRAGTGGGISTVEQFFGELQNMVGPRRFGERCILGVGEAHHERGDDGRQEQETAGDGQQSDTMSAHELSCCVERSIGSRLEYTAVQVGLNIARQRIGGSGSGRSG